MTAEQNPAGKLAKWASLVQNFIIHIFLTVTFQWDWRKRTLALVNTQIEVMTILEKLLLLFFFLLFALQFWSLPITTNQWALTPREQSDPDASASWDVFCCSNGAMSAQSSVYACVQSNAYNLIHMLLAGCAEGIRARNQMHREDIFGYLNVGQMPQIWMQWCGTALREPLSVLLCHRQRWYSACSQIKVTWLYQKWTSCFFFIFKFMSLWSFSFDKWSGALPQMFLCRSYGNDLP